MHKIFSKFVVSFVFACACYLSGYAQTSRYNQPYRPQVHFSPRENWTNDPNGLVYFRGEYHLFFQYNPFGDEWGHMSWGHAVSKDLLHWEQLPVAIPEKDGVAIFTGSTVVDTKNTSGFCTNGGPCLVAIYTGNSNPASGPLQNQNLAYSLDNGRTWTTYAGNPVLDLHLADFRDPSVSWNEQTQRWIMAVALPVEHKVRFYSSPNLKEWTLQSEFGPAGSTAGVWECPDLLRIPSADNATSIWALKVGLNPGAPNGGSGEQYFLGDFDGKTFTISNQAGSHGWTNYGKDDYCAISYNGLPKNDMPVLVGWMDNWQYAAKQPTSPWRGQMSIPRRLIFTNDEAGMALKQEPAVASLREKEIAISPSLLIKGLQLTTPSELHLDFGNSKQRAFGIRLYSDESHWTEIGFDRTKRVFYMDRTKSGQEISPDFPARTEAPLVIGRKNDLNLIVDRSSVEAFAQNNTIAMTNLIFPLSPGNRVKLQTTEKSSALKSIRIWNLRTIWDQ